MDMEQLSAGRGTLTAVRTGQGRDLVVLHSLLADRHAFDPVLPALAARHRVTLINLPGFHGSAPTPLALMDSYVAAIEDGFQEFGIGNDSIVGNAGYSVLGSPTTLNWLFPAWMVVQLLSVAVNSMSPGGNSFTISNSLRADMVTPPLVIMVALYRPRIPISRSVAMVSTPSCLASNRMLDSIGIVLRFATTPCTR